MNYDVSLTINTKTIKIKVVYLIIRIIVIYLWDKVHADNNVLCEKTL